MLAVLLPLALIAYAIIYTALAQIATGKSPGILESLSPSFTGTVLRGSGGSGGIPILSPSPGSAGGPNRDEATPQIRTILGALGAIPGWSLGAICGPGSVDNSEHQNCNAADIMGARAVLFLVKNALVAAGRSRALPIHCVIGPSTHPGWEKGEIRSRESNWQPREYTGPNTHQNHVHVSGWPSIGGGC